MNESIKKILSKETIDWLEEAEKIYGSTLRGQRYIDSLIDMLIYARMEGQTIAMLKLGFSVDDISKSVKLSEMEIQNIKRKMEIENRKSKFIALENCEIEITKNLLLNGIDINVISSSTGLTIEQIEEIKSQL